MYGKIIPVVKKYDEALNQADFSKLNLIIQLAIDGASFCIFNIESSKFLSIESVEFENPDQNDNVGYLLKQLFQDHLIRANTFNSVYILFESNSTSLVPIPLFDENEKASFSNFSFTGRQNCQLMHDKINNIEAYNLYLVPKVLIETAGELFPGHINFGHSKILIESLLIKYKNSLNQKRIFANVRSSCLDILVLEGKKLLYYNIFSYKTREDFVYFIIFVMDQLNLNPEESELKLSGYIDKNSKIFDILYKYIRHVSFLERTNSFSYSYLFGDIPSHYFFSLLNLPVCGS
ncbi:MAG: DUF3822 family protein [Bacteroidetes bacterium]|nr:DUF3822 family protein [Bacteroidota bacterium]